VKRRHREVVRQPCARDRLGLPGGLAEKGPDERRRHGVAPANRGACATVAASLVELVGGRSDVHTGERDARLRYGIPTVIFTIPRSIGWRGS
jgi:hypothetical protein